METTILGLGFRFLGTPVVPFSPFCFGVSLIEAEDQEKGYSYY